MADEQMDTAMKAATDWYGTAPEKPQQRAHLAEVIRRRFPPAGKETPMSETTPEEKYPLIDYTDKPECQACGGRKFAKHVSPYEYGRDWRAGRSTTTKHDDARYVTRECRRCKQLVRMKYKADSMVLTTYRPPRARRAAWWFVKTPFRLVGWAIRNPTHAIVYAVAGRLLWKSPEKAWELAAWLGDTVMAMVG